MLGKIFPKRFITREIVDIWYSHIQPMFDAESLFEVARAWTLKPDLPFMFQASSSDLQYSVNRNTIVLGILTPGTTPAASVARGFRSSFPEGSVIRSLTVYHDFSILHREIEHFINAHTCFIHLRGSLHYGFHAGFLLPDTAAMYPQYRRRAQPGLLGFERTMIIIEDGNDCVDKVDFSNPDFWRKVASCWTKSLIFEIRSSSTRITFDRVSFHPVKHGPTDSILEWIREISLKLVGWFPRLDYVEFRTNFYGKVNVWTKVDLQD